MSQVSRVNRSHIGDINYGDTFQPFGKYIYSYSIVGTISGDNYGKSSFNTNGRVMLTIGNTRFTVIKKLQILSVVVGDVTLSSGTIIGGDISPVGNYCAIAISYGAGNINNEIQIYKINNASVTLVQSITIANCTAHNKSSTLFGKQVIFSQDRIFVLIYETTLSQCCVFKNAGGTYTFERLFDIAPGNVTGENCMGASASGDILALGIPNNTLLSKANGGGLNIYVRSHLTWTLTNTLNDIISGMNTYVDGYWGGNISVSPDGITIAVGVLSTASRYLVVILTSEDRWSTVYTDSISPVHQEILYGNSIDMNNNTLVVQQGTSAYIYKKLYRWYLSGVCDLIYNNLTFPALGENIFAFANTTRYLNIGEAAIYPAQQYAIKRASLSTKSLVSSIQLASNEEFVEITTGGAGNNIILSPVPTDGQRIIIKFSAISTSISIVKYDFGGSSVLSSTEEVLAAADYNIGDIVELLYIFQGDTWHVIRS